jgi:hypothetical protein
MKEEKFHSKIRKVQSRKRNTFEHNSKPEEIMSDERRLFGMSAGFCGSETYIKGVKVPSNTNKLIK